MTLRTTVITCYLIATSLVSFSVASETLHLKNPDWREIPGTKWDGSPSVIEMTGLTHRGDKYTFDLLGGDLHYARIELNCADKRYRLLREGYYQGEGRIEYQAPSIDGWLSSDNNHIHYFAKFICR